MLAHLLEGQGDVLGGVAEILRDHCAVVHLVKRLAQAECNAKRGAGLAGARQALEVQDAAALLGLDAAEGLIYFWGALDAATTAALMFAINGVMPLGAGGLGQGHVPGRDVAEGASVEQHAVKAPRDGDGDGGCVLAACTAAAVIAPIGGAAGGIDEGEFKLAVAIEVGAIHGDAALVVDELRDLRLETSGSLNQKR